MKITNCTKCGREVTYKTKVPKLCAKCRGTTKRKGGSSAGELNMFYLLNEIIKLDYINNGYYSWLMSPKGSPMQLDRYYPDIGLGFEYQGKQHLEYSSFFHKTKKQFEYLQKCDALKSKLCSQRGVTLIHIRYDKKVTKEYLIMRIREMNPTLFSTLVKNKLLNLT